MAETALECYGVVGMKGSLRGRIARGKARARATEIRHDGDGGVTADLHVVVEYGLNLAEVASSVRNRVAYEVERLTAAGARRRGARRRCENLREVTAATDIDRVRVLKVGSALSSLEASRARIDDLNVYPVPDGDTGTNLTLTVRGRGGSWRLEADRLALAHEVRALRLLGARGNSGVILSQIVRGAIRN